MLNLTLETIGRSVQNLEQEKAIMQVVEDYFEGTRTGDIKLIHNAFDKDAKLKHVKVDGRLFEADLKHFTEYLTAKQGMPVLATHILSIDIASTIATVKVLFVFEDFIYIDFLHILQIGNSWKIVDKVYLKKKRGNMF